MHVREYTLQAIFITNILHYQEKNDQKTMFSGRKRI